MVTYLFIEIRLLRCKYAKNVLSFAKIFVVAFENFINNSKFMDIWAEFNGFNLFSVSWLVVSWRHASVAQTIVQTHVELNYVQIFKISLLDSKTNILLHAANEFLLSRAEKRNGEAMSWRIAIVLYKRFIEKSRCLPMYFHIAIQMYEISKHYH